MPNDQISGFFFSRHFFEMSSSSESHAFFNPSSVPGAKNVAIEGPVSLLESGFLGSKSWVRHFLQLVDDEPMATLRCYSKIEDLVDGKRPHVVYDLTMVIDIVESPSADWLELWFSNGAVERLRVESAAMERSRWIAHMLRSAPRVRAILLRDPSASHEVPMGLSSRQLRSELLRSARARAVSDPAVAEIVGSHEDFFPSSSEPAMLPGTFSANSTSASIAARDRTPASASRRSSYASPSRGASLIERAPLSSVSPAPALPPQMPNASFAREVADRVASSIKSSADSNAGGERSAAVESAALTRDTLEGLTAAVATLAAASDRTYDRVADLTKLVQSSLAEASRAAANAARVEEAVAKIDKKVDALGAAIMAVTAKVEGQSARGVEHASELNRIMQAVYALRPTPAAAGGRRAHSPGGPDVPSLSNELHAMRAQQRDLASTLDTLKTAVEGNLSNSPSRGGDASASSQELTVLRALVEQAASVRDALTSATGADLSRAANAAGAAARIPTALRNREDIAALLNRLRAVEAAIANTSGALPPPPRAASPSRTPQSPAGKSYAYGR